MGQTVVFVVDDEVVIAKTLTIILSKAGFQAYAAAVVTMPWRRQKDYS